MPRTIREWGSAARARAAAFFDYLSDSFRPILGVLLGASLVIAIVNVIVALGIVPDGETSTGWILLKAIWEGVFTVLPIMIAYNAAKKLDVASKGPASPRALHSRMSVATTLRSP